jgi:hypothetical protein
MRRNRIVFIDPDGFGSALVKVQVQAPSGRYSDYLSMLKLGEGWRIVAKVFALVRRTLLNAFRPVHAECVGDEGNNRFCRMSLITP